METSRPDTVQVQLAINTVRTLSIDAVQQAKSGHPGTPMALAPLIYTMWNRVLQYDPQDPIWANRDRFVLSNGHASMLLWSILHLTGVQAVDADYERLGEPAVTLDDIRRFRQLGSKAPGHPEYRWVSGVETTTGPLGQGVATAVGMAIAQKWLANRYNRPGFELFNYNVHAVCGDGCLMEGNGKEAVALFEQLRPDLIWMDVRMPVMDGFEAVRRIRAAKAGADTKIIALTAHALEEEKRAVMAAGCDDFVRKPFREQEIFDALARHLRLKFIYESLPGPETISEAPGLILRPEQLKGLPAELLRDLRQAVIELDTARTQALIEQVAERDASLGRALNTLATHVSR